MSDQIDSSGISIAHDAPETRPMRVVAVLLLFRS